MQSAHSMYANSFNRHVLTAPYSVDQISNARDQMVDGSPMTQTAVFVPSDKLDDFVAQVRQNRTFVYSNNGGHLGTILDVEVYCQLPFEPNYIAEQAVIIAVVR